MAEVITDEELTELIYSTDGNAGDGEISPSGDDERQSGEGGGDLGVDLNQNSSNDRDGEPATQNQNDGYDDDDLDADYEPVDGNGDYDGSKSLSEAQEFRPVRANGKNIPINTMDELYTLASAGAGATKKFQAIAGHVNTIAAADKAGVDLMDSVTMMANYREDPKAAILKMIKDNGLDPYDFDIDGETDYKPKDYSVSDFEVQYDEIVSDIGKTPEFEAVQDVLSNQWDGDSRQVFFDDPTNIRHMHEEMQKIEGSDVSMWDLVSPEAEKMKLSGDTRPSLDVYMDARSSVVDKLYTHAESIDDKQRDVTSRKRGSGGTKGSTSKGESVDLSKLSDAALDKLILSGT